MVYWEAPITVARIFSSDIATDATKADFRYYSGGSPAEFKHCQRAFGKTTFLPTVNARG